MLRKTILFIKGKVMKNIEKYLDSIVIGIRYRPNFAIMDKFGFIIDSILYSKKSYFNEQYFPFVHHGTPNERILYHNEYRHFLTLNPSNVILDTKEENQKYDETFKNFKNQILNGILDDVGIQQIQRIGVIKRYIIEDEELCKNFINRTIAETITGVNDINLRFSKKYTIQEAKLRKDVLDYHNVIYTIVKKANENIINISIDFQRHYTPILERPSMIEFDKFKTEVDNYNKKDVDEWLKRFGKTEK